MKKFLESKKKDVDKELSAERTGHEATRKTLETLKSEKEQLDKDHAATKKSLERLQKDLDAAKAEADKLKTDLEISIFKVRKNTIEFRIFSEIGRAHV